MQEPGRVSPSGVSFSDDSSGAGVSIRHAAAIVGVQAPTIRSWERRYGLAHPPVTAGGHRRYQEADLQRLALMRDEIIRGRPPADAAVAAQRTVDRDHAARALTDAFLRAAQDMDAAGLHVVLDEARATFGLGRAIDDVLMTGMRLIGLKWRTGRCDVAEEHLATQAARAWLTHQTRNAGSPTPARAVVLACGPDSQHTLGLDALALLLTLRGWRCLNLGARTPVKSVTHAATAHSAAGVVIVAHMATNRQAAVASIRAATDLGVQVFYAGHAFTRESSRRSVPGTYLPDSIAQADLAVHSRLTRAHPIDHDPRTNTSGRRSSRSR